MKPTLFIFLCLLLFATSAPLAVHGQGSSWLPPVPVSPLRITEEQARETGERRYGSSWFPDMAVGPQDSVHIIWYSGIGLDKSEGGSLDLLMYRKIQDGQWSPVNEIAAPGTGGFTVRNSMMLGRDGRLHVAYRSGTRIVYSRAPWQQAGSAQAWSTPRPISSFGAAYYTALATDEQGNIHILWSEAFSDSTETGNTACLNCADMYYRSSPDGGNTWSEPINLSNTPDGENRPQIAVDQRGRIHAVWDEGIDWYAGAGEPKVGVYRHSDDGGRTWSEPTYFRLPERIAELAANQQRGRDRNVISREPTPVTATATPATPPAFDAVQQTTLSLDRDGNPLVVFRGAYINRIFSQYSPDGGSTWESATELGDMRTRPSDLDVYSMAADGAGNVHLLMVGYRSREAADDLLTPPALWHLTWQGGRWTVVDAVMDNELYPEYPRLVIANGNALHATWFTRSREDLFDSERASYRVWYSSTFVNAPAIAPLPMFTPVPEATAQPTATPLPPPPTPTALPAWALEAAPVAEPPRWESLALQTIGLALLPVLALIGGVMLIRRRKRG